ncbi:MAG TPA: cysteine dioxygenase [Ottowia sp.]|jgi:predicted metal-dependent enzyme (double-stranded beta helix superfamily)|nr:MAG: cysteine dioxygenase [Burkholderiales bacterium 68-10]HMT56553.1 cysteine dioxygenase [Ottowia sp.]HMT82111.1 cysteine dioxygenase [Ottowia sp.]HOK10801.1 cysteine dioxygenase [Ottowia sp.]HOM19322.1 cysteine dioxygenase [Ottowia sp.]
MAAETRLLHFVAAMTRLVEAGPPDEARLLEGAQPLMKALVAHDDWLPEPMAAAHPQYYQQHLLYGDPLDRFSLVSFVWGPGQKTPVHDHTVWGVIGMLRGTECAQRYTRDAQGRIVASGAEATLRPGDIDTVSPTLGDIHVVRNGLDDQVSISIHLYGGNIGRISRHVFVPGTETVKDFVSGYSNALSPNLWARRLP